MCFDISFAIYRFIYACCPTFHKSGAINRFVSEPEELAEIRICKLYWNLVLDDKPFMSYCRVRVTSDNTKTCRYLADYLSILTIFSFAYQSISGYALRNKLVFSTQVWVIPNEMSESEATKREGTVLLCLLLQSYNS